MKKEDLIEKIEKELKEMDFDKAISIHNYYCEENSDINSIIYIQCR